MEDFNTLNKISKHIAGEETLEEKTIFLDWLKASESNRVLFNKINNSWQEFSIKEGGSNYWKKFTKKNIRTVILNEALVNFISFVVGVSVTNLFSTYIIERKGIGNLFGLMKRKQVEVNLIPSWAQWTLSVVAGFIVLEFVNHFIQTKKHIIIVNSIKKHFNNR